MRLLPSFPAWLTAYLQGHLSAAFAPPGWRGGLLLVALSVFTSLPVQAAQTITLLLSEPTGIYQETAQALQQELARDDGRWIVRLQHVDERPGIAGDEWVVTLGVRALKYALDAEGVAPLFAVLVPSLTFEKLLSDHPQASRRRPVSALFLDQPYARQLQLIRLALPQAKRVGVLVGPVMESQAGELKKASREAGLEIRIFATQTREQLFASLNDLAREVDVLLLLPDPQVVSGENLQGLFLRTYQQRLSVAAYAASLVRAGATLGLYATPAQFGVEMGKWVRETDGEKVANGVTTRFPQRYTVEINRNVARTLELPLPTVESLSRRLDTEHGR
ncbi:MAG: hypothetical protein B7X94_00135 [Hydrogenophilales bacterium 17-62-8]|nr:MAG: hypothetical protein B7X94_00135 [Hydrogenophilales bacterium 17-62-8]